MLKHYCSRNTIVMFNLFHLMDTGKVLYVFLVITCPSLLD